MGDFKITEAQINAHVTELMNTHTLKEMERVLPGKRLTHTLVTMSSLEKENLFNETIDVNKNECFKHLKRGRKLSKR